MTKGINRRCSGGAIAALLMAVLFFGVNSISAKEAQNSSDTVTEKPESNKPEREASVESLASEWGIKVSALRVSANGNIVDFRYRVLDPQKAARLADPEISPVLIDQESGTKLHVPSTKAGQLRGTAKHLVAGKIYIMLFANPSKAVKPGHKVTLEVGDSKHTDLLVGK